MAISPFRHISSQRWWVKAIAWVTAVVAFLFAAVLVSPLSAKANQNAELIGALSFYGLTALVFGMYQLIKGWNLVVEGNTATDGLEPPVEKQSHSFGLYVLMLAGVLLLTLWLGLLNFSASSDVASDVLNRQTPQKYCVLTFLFITLLISWPYQCWRQILQRDPNSISSNVKLHRRVSVVLACLFIVVISVTTTFGVQNGHDRKLTTQIESVQTSLLDIAAKVAKLKSRDLRTIDDYVQTYGELEPVLDEYDLKLQVVEGQGKAYEQQGQHAVESVDSSEGRLTFSGCTRRRKSG
jgi:type IV secretory pathway VirB2 component (pilin)